MLQNSLALYNTSEAKLQKLTPQRVVESAVLRNHYSYWRRIVAYRNLTRACLFEVMEVSQPTSWLLCAIFLATYNLLVGK